MWHEDDKWWGIPWGGSVSSINTKPPIHPHFLPSKPAVAQDNCRTATQNKKSKLAAANTQPGPDGMPAASRAGCGLGVRQGGAPLKQTVGRSCWVKGIWGVCRLCVWGVWPLSDSLRWESAAFHKCIKVSSQRDKQKKENVKGWGVGGRLADRPKSKIKNKTWKPMQTLKSHSGWDFSELVWWEIFKKWIKWLFQGANELNWLQH